MVRHKKIYLKHFNYGEQDFVPCENCSGRAVDVHHLVYRSHGGDDSIENLMGLCRKCHDKAHDCPDYNKYLQHIHYKRLKQMKTLLTVLLLSIVLSATSQDWIRPVSIISYHIGTVALGAVGDAMYDEGNKNLSHALHAAEVGMLIGGPFLFKIKRNEAINYILSYGFLRFSFFDSFYNITRDLPLLYNGSTSAYDRFMSQMPPDGRVWWKTHSLVVGIAIPIKEF